MINKDLIIVVGGMTLAI